MAAPGLLALMNIRMAGKQNFEQAFTGVFAQFKVKADWLKKKATIWSTMLRWEIYLFHVSVLLKNKTVD